MPSPQRKLGSHLEWHKGMIRVTLGVPKALQGIVGKTRIKRSLNTDSPANAERIKHGVIQQLKDELHAAATSSSSGTAGHLQDGLEWRAALDGVGSTREGEALRFHVVDRAEEIEAKEGYQKAQEFAQVAFGKLTPILSLLEPYLKEKDMRERSKGDARRAVAAYIEWAGQNNAPMSIEGIERKVAGRFVSERLLAQMEKKTAQKYLSFLSGYWTWLEVKGYAKDVPWTRQLQRVGKQRRSANLLGDGPSPTGGKRAYSEEETRLVLNYAPTTSVEQRSVDLAWIAALSGMRLDEICRLTVADCAGGWFNVNSKAGDGKTLASTRRIPIHSALAPLIAKRTKGKAADDYLIHDLTEPKEGRERSMPASKAYGKLREKLGVGGKPDGQRQSNVDFHSWRRWFAGMARDAGNTDWTVAAVLGHDTSGLKGNLTMGVKGYAGAVKDDALVACVESVQLP